MAMMTGQIAFQPDVDLHGADAQALKSCHAGVAQPLVKTVFQGWVQDRQIHRIFLSSFIVT